MSICDFSCWKLKLRVSLKVVKVFSLSLHARKREIKMSDELSQADLCRGVGVLEVFLEIASQST